MIHQWAWQVTTPQLSLITVTTALLGIDARATNRNMVSDESVFKVL